jgi:cell division protein FtsB
MRKLTVLTSTGAIVALIGVSLLLGRQQYTQWQQRKNINKEIDKLKAQQAQLQKENDQLTKSLSFLNTPAYKEQIARQQLNLKKDGELVVNFPDQAISSEATQSANQKSSSNFEKWWTYLFKQ